MHSLTVDRDTISDEEKEAVLVSVASVDVEVTGSEARLALSFSALVLVSIKYWEGQHY